MKTRDPLEGLKRIWDEVSELEGRTLAGRRRGEFELRRLSRNKNRDHALHHAYWDPQQRVSVAVLAQIFCLEVKTIALEAGPIKMTTSCNLCGVAFELEVKTRSARRELQLEGERSTVNPQHKICSSCSVFRETDLELLRKKKGQRLDGFHLAAYRKYLSTPQWAERRARALKRAKNKCSLCSSKKHLNVHHRTYARIGQERDEDLIVLCLSCHETFHEEGHTH